MNQDAHTLLTALGGDGYLSICWKPPGAHQLSSVVLTLPEALATIDAVGDTADLWYGVNRMTQRPPSGRGRAADITRITCLYADLDTGKPLTPATISEARTIIDGLPDPVFIVYSGHGLQPIWPLSGGEFATSDPVILGRWGQLIADRAAARGWVTDNVYDLARILRVPGTVNHKYPGKPVRARLEHTGGVPLTYDDVTSVLDEHERTRPPRAHIIASGPARPAASSHAVRQWLDQVAAFQHPSSSYGTQAMDELLAEYGTRENSRHRWMVRSVTRVLELAAAGQIDAHRSLTVIRDRFTALLAGERPALPEFIEGVAWGVGQLTPSPNGNSPAEDSATPAGTAPVVDTLAGHLASGDIILDEPSTPPSIWGDGEEAIWAEGESLIVAGPDGVGKTTLAGQIVRARLGIGPPAVLGMPVRRGDRNLLYLMMDRPRQIRRALRRVFTEADRAALKERLILWQGPPPADLARDTSMLLRLCILADADTVIVDSLKDAALKLSDDETGAGWNRARQNVTAAGIEILELHHPRKEQSDNKKPATLADLFGSRWISAGAGSVLMIWGKAGDPVVELIHIKQPAAEIGPWQLRIDRATGGIEREHGVSLLTEIRYHAGQVTAKDAAQILFGTQSPTRAEVEKARSRLDKLVADGVLTEQGGGRGHGPVTWHLSQAPDSVPDSPEQSDGSQKINKSYPVVPGFQQVNAVNGLSGNQSDASQAPSQHEEVRERGGIYTPVPDFRPEQATASQSVGTSSPPACPHCGERHERYGQGGRPCVETR